MQKQKEKQLCISNLEYITVNPYMQKHTERQLCMSNLDYFTVNRTCRSTKKDNSVYLIWTILL